jgi:hypothetical protein
LDQDRKWQRNRVFCIMFSRLIHFQTWWDEDDN